MNGRENITEKYWITCPNCHEAYDACRAEWCICITASPTLACPRCGHCFCDASVDFRRNFWDNAPKSIISHRLKQAYGRKIPFSCDQGNPIRRPLIMVVDDEENTRTVAFYILEALGYGSILARDGKEALALTRKFRPDLILTDHMMPNMKGRELCKRLKEDPDTRDIPVIIMTCLYHKMEKERIEFLKKYGANDFLNKPIPYERLCEIIDAWLAPGPVN